MKLMDIKNYNLIIEDFVKSMLSYPKYRIRLFSDGGLGVKNTIKNYFPKDDREEFLIFMEAIEIKKKKDSYENESDKVKFFVENLTAMEEGKLEGIDGYATSLIRKYKDFIESIEKEKEYYLNSLIVSIASEFEILMNNLISFTLRYIYNDDYFANKKLSYKEIKMLKTHQEIKDYLIEQQVRDMMYSNFNEQVKYFFEICGDKKSKELSNNVKLLIQEVKEIQLRKNLITHNSSIINKDFLEKTNNHDYDKIGEKLNVTLDYVDNCWKKVLKLGLKFIATNYVSKKELVSEDRIIINTLCMDLMNNGMYDIAKYFAQIIIDNNKIININSLLIEYNYILAKKFSGKEINRDLEKFQQHMSLLESQGNDMEQFHFGVAILIKSTDEAVDEAISYILAKDDKNIQINMLSWSVFKVINNKDKFIEFKKELYYN